MELIEPKIGEMWTSKHPSGYGDAENMVREFHKYGVLIYSYDKEKDEILHLIVERLAETIKEHSPFGGRLINFDAGLPDKPPYRYKLKLDAIPRLNFYTTGQGSCTLQQLNDNYVLNDQAVYEGR